MVRAYELYKAYRADARQTMADLREALDRSRRGAPGGVRPSEFSLRGLAEHLITDRHGDPLGALGLAEYLNGRLTEAGGAVTSSAFRDVTGAVINAAVMEGYDLPEYALSAAVPSLGPGRAAQAQLRGISIPMQDGKVVEVAEAKSSRRSASMESTSAAGTPRSSERWWP